MVTFHKEEMIEDKRKDKMQNSLATGEFVIVA